jgi:GNAT superfamily N-acetyltransferase
MAAAPLRIRPAAAADAGAVAGLAEGLAQSFAFSQASFDAHYPALLATGHACLLVAVTGADAAEDDCVGYLLGFEHLTFYANGHVAWVEEVFVRGDLRGRGIGRALMTEFERWARGRGCALVALATRRAAPFYHALGYEDSAAYLRKLLPGRG